MKLSRVLMGRVAGVAACFTLVALGGCGSSVAAMDGGNGDGAITDGGRTLDDASRSDGDGALPDAANVDGGVARGDALAMAVPLRCVDGEWCPELPSNFVDLPMLVGDQPVATIENRVYVRRANEWTRVVCPADSGTSDPPVLFAADSNVTIARCGTRRYRWSADGLAPIDWPAGAVEQVGGVFGLPDVVFSIVQLGGNRFVVRCTDAGCDSIELDSIGGDASRAVFARSSNEYWVLDSGSTAWRHTATGWRAEAAALLPRPPEVPWTPEPLAECIRDGRWVACSRAPFELGPFRPHVRTRRAVIASSPFGEVVLFDGAATQRLRLISTQSFVRDNWPGLALESFLWAGPSAIDGVRDGVDDRLFMVFAVGRLAEHTSQRLAWAQKIFTKLGDGPWIALPDGQLGEGYRSSIAVSSPSNLWVLDYNGIRHFVDGSWSVIAGPYSDLCALSDGSVIARFSNYIVVHISATGVLDAQANLNALVACTHDHVWKELSGTLSRWVGDAWVSVPDPPIAAASREYGQSDLGITVRNRGGNEAYVWDGAAWQRRDEANASFFVDPHRVRFATREWKVVGAPGGALLCRDRR